jgi:hypothetical protein
MFAILTAVVPKEYLPFDPLDEETQERLSPGFSKSSAASGSLGCVQD